MGHPDQFDLLLDHRQQIPAMPIAIHDDKHFQVTSAPDAGYHPAQILGKLAILQPVLAVSAGSDECSANQRSGYDVSFHDKLLKNQLRGRLQLTCPRKRISPATGCFAGVDRAFAHPTGQPCSQPSPLS
jgi:hypothetical protein